MYGDYGRGMYGQGRGADYSTSTTSSYFGGVGKQVYGPDNGWYYRVKGSAIERAYPASGRNWESVAEGTGAYTAIQAMIPSLAKSSSNAVAALMQAAPTYTAPTTSSTFVASTYSEPSSTPTRQRRRQATTTKTDTWKIAGIGVGGLVAVGLILYFTGKKD